MSKMTRRGKWKDFKVGVQGGSQKIAAWQIGNWMEIRHAFDAFQCIVFQFVLTSNKINEIYHSLLGVLHFGGWQLVSGAIGHFL
jgi:hypothetical protein